MALTLSRASLFCLFLGIVLFCIFTISSYVQIHLLLHFRNYTSIHPMIDGGGDVEVLAYVNSNLLVIHNDHSNENNKNLVKSSSKETKQQKENRRFSSSVPSVPIASPAANIEVKTLVPQNLSKPSDKGVTLINEAVISKAKDKQVSSDVELAKQNSVAAASAVLNSVNSKTAEDDKISNKNPENANTELRKPAVAAAAAATVSEKKTVKVVKKVDDPIVANFTVEGWPESKSRIATDYVNYDEQTAILQPNQVFLSPDAGDVSQPQVLIAVQSGPKNKELRNEVRRTWGGACKTVHQSWCSVIFVLGEFDDYEVQSKLEEESAEHGDILQETFQDSYNNLTIKSIFILKYYVGAADNLGNKFLLKTDDDSFVHLEALWDLAKSRMAKKSNNLIGYLQLGLKKHHYLPLAHKPTRSNLKRKAWLKWLIPTYMYNKRFFPQFLSGSGYLVTQTGAECLLLKSKTIPIVHLEDVYITGLCASSCHLRREHDKGFKARPMDKISEYQLQTSDIVLHYTSGKMDRFSQQVVDLANQVDLNDDP